MSNKGEAERLIRKSDDDVGLLGYKSSGEKSAELQESSLAAALSLIQEQTNQLELYKRRLKDEEEKNRKLVERVDAVSSDLLNLKKVHQAEKEQCSTELRSIRKAMEAQKELQASCLDEVRFQINSLRGKIDRGAGHGAFDGKAVNSPVKASLLEDSVQPARQNELPPSNHVFNDSLSLSGSNPCLISHSSLAHRGEVIWRINAFAKKLHKIQSKTYEDPSRGEPFTTGVYGYRLCLWAYLNGRGKGEGTHLSIYVRVMAGEFDPILMWPIRPCYTISLISQHPDANKRYDLVRVRDLSLKHQSSISRPLKDDKCIIVGFDDFIIHEDLERKGFLVDDSLFVKCVVDIHPS